MIRNTKSILIFFFALYTSLTFSQRTLQLESTLLQEREVAIDLDVPWEITWGPYDHIWLTERSGG